MNLYLRYFDKETLVYNVEEALDFLRSIPEIGMTPNLEADVRDYANSEVYYPKKYKIRPRRLFYHNQDNCCYNARLQAKESIALCTTE